MNVHDHAGVQALLDDLGLTLLPQRFTPRYNLAPTDLVHVAFADATPQLARMRWGLLPRNPRQGGLMINARAETAWEKRSFRDAMRTRRAVIPVNGFYEWQRQGERKTAFYITGDRPALAVAGLFDIDAEGEMRCCVLTTEANAAMREVHDRMPVTLAAGTLEDWLCSRDRAQVDALIDATQERVLHPLAVSGFVNNSRNDGPQCIAPLPAAADAGP